MGAIRPPRSMAIKRRYAEHTGRRATLGSTASSGLTLIACCKECTRWSPTWPNRPLAIARTALAGDTVNGLTATSRTGRWERAEYGLVLSLRGVCRMGRVRLQHAQPATDGGKVLNDRRHRL